MHIKFDGTISRSDYLRALKLHYRRFNPLKWVLGIILILLVAAGVYLLVRDSSKLLDMLASSFPGNLVILLGLTALWWLPYFQLLSYNQAGNVYRSKIFGSISDSGININGTVIKTSYKWDAFSFYRLGRDVLLIYSSKNDLNLFTRAMFTGQEEWDQFTSLVKSKVPVRK